MVELLRTADQVMLSFARALLTGSGIDHQVAGRLDGDPPVGGSQPRLLVPDDRLDDARWVLADAGLLETATR
ncbi:putative signal transducing protein [Pseudonocardia humida]|uniref:DUF2007 domain-containing protein n=1 Tax=Pseudonocardia humida TaxID=2800819 RepID=A0ABT1A7W4_9PSEU|nr:DUF2007 domain-containing protein [Pseudonocardia humida]MCO1659117.1 DUF2007 domain-containing protein [Pseudonocardia humida]